jgi:hypothetical protein
MMQLAMHGHMSQWHNIKPFNPTLEVWLETTRFGSLNALYPYDKCQHIFNKVISWKTMVV